MPNFNLFAISYVQLGTDRHLKFERLEFGYQSKAQQQNVRPSTYVGRPNERNDVTGNLAVMTAVRPMTIHR